LPASGVFNISETGNADSVEREDVNQEGFPVLWNLTKFSYKNTYRDSVITLLQSIAPQLLELELRIPIYKVDFIRPVLEAATRLELLSLHVDSWGKPADLGPTITTH
jgi:hypothetical protein